MSKIFSKSLSNFFFKKKNQMQGNSGKFHLILNTKEPVEMSVGESLAKSTNCEKLLDLRNFS